MPSVASTTPFLNSYPSFNNSKSDNTRAKHCMGSIFESFVEAKSPIPSSVKLPHSLVIPAVADVEVDFIARIVPSSVTDHDPGYFHNLLSGKEIWEMLPANVFLAVSD